MNGEITRQLDELFLEWKKSYPYFIEDGLMLKTEGIRNVENDWCTSKMRIMFFMKDQNQGKGVHWSEDSRLWIQKDKKGTILNKTSFKNLANLLYGFSNVGIQDYQQVWFGELDPAKVRNHFYNYTFAFVEGKKEPGGSSIVDKTLKEYLTRDKGFIKREIEILNPNVIVCFGGPIFDFTINLYGKNSLSQYGINGNLRYSKEFNTILVYSEHPSKPFLKAQSFYETCMDSYRAFLKTPEGSFFTNQCALNLPNQF